MHLVVSWFVIIILASGEQDALWQLTWLFFLPFDLPFSLIVPLLMPLFRGWSITSLPYPIGEVNEFLLPAFIVGIVGPLWYFLLPVIISGLRKRKV
jgi:hypothetical protein